MRADVFDRIRALKPAFIRWPGGNVAQDYHWQWGVGARDQRPVWVNLSWRNELEPGDFGTDEFLAMTRRLGTLPTLTVNVEGRGANKRRRSDSAVNGKVTGRTRRIYYALEGAIAAKTGRPGNNRPLPLVRNLNEAFGYRRAIIICSGPAHHYTIIWCTGLWS